MPDIDTDIQDTRRDEVIEYCSNKYGFDRVSNIATFGKMMAKNAVRDVARVLEVPYAEADRLAKMVPDPVMGHHVKLADAIKDVPDLKQEYETGYFNNPSPVVTLNSPKFDSIISQSIVIIASSLIYVTTPVCVGIFSIISSSKFIFPLFTGANLKNVYPDSTVSLRYVVR